jgi:xylan 1,4-beta-xylosidase
MDDRVCRAVAKVKGEIQASAMPDLPLFWTEWNVQGMNESRDTTFVGPALANTIRECDGKVNMMSFWTFSDVFEEGGPIPRPFEGQFGLRAKGGINKPSYYGFELLHQLGNERLANRSNDILVTKAKDGTLAVAVWNLVDPDKHGTTRSIDIEFRGVSPNATITLQRVDDEHGNVLPKYAAMGKPLDPTPQQVEELNRETALGAPEPMHLKEGKLRLALEPNALVLIKINTGTK